MDIGLSIIDAISPCSYCGQNDQTFVLMPSGICLVEHFAPHDPVIASQYFVDGEVGGCTILASMQWHLGH